MSLSEELGLTKFTLFEEKEDWSDPEYCLRMVRQHNHALQYVKEQTPEICLEAVKQDGYALQYVEEQTYEICLEAVKQNGFALQYVEEQTYKLCLTAVKQNGRALQFVKEQALELCLAAVRQNRHAVNHANINILPIKDWDTEWFRYLSNIELRRQFIRERGKEVFQQLDNLGVIKEDDEYCLVGFKYNEIQEDFQKALIFKCPSTNDIYFTEVPKETKSIKNALKFLNSGISKEELAYES